MHRQMLVLGLETFKERSRAVDRVFAYSEDFYLFGALVARSEIAQIISSRASGV
jgi:hypothetical protein